MRQPVEGVSTSITAFVGAAADGPRDTPVEVTGITGFERDFGAQPTTPLACAVRLYFDNGGRRALIVRAGSGLAISAQDVSEPSLRAAGRGLWALGKVDLFNLLCIPPFASGAAGDIGAQTRRAAADFCSERHAFFIADPLDTWTTPDDVIGGVQGVESATWGLPRTRNAAVYFPGLRLADPRHPGQEIACAPCGAVAGVYARTDDRRGVWRAPAGVEATIAGVTGLTMNLTDLEQGRLNPQGVNVLRTFPGRGHAVWGARTLEGTNTSGSEWKYVPVRRLALFIEESIARGIQWAVFEPNDAALWSELRREVGAFMDQLFRSGAFSGATARAAYFVKCDAETTTRADIDQGVVTIDVGFAPLRPAEFVVLRFRQRTAREGT